MLAKSRRFSVVTVLVCCSIGYGCSDSPTQPEATRRADGLYAGRAEIRSSTPPGHCFSAGLELLGGSHTLDFEAEIGQSGPTLSGTLASIDFAQSCSVAGSIDTDGDLFFDQVRCVPECVVFDWAASPGEVCRLRACPNATSVTGAAESDGAIRGQLRIEWDTFDANTDDILRRVIIAGPIELTRSGLE